jgi:hypothetical protein
MPMPHHLAKAVLHKLAIIAGIVLLSIILHKGVTDVSVIAEKHSGRQFWVALGKYFIGNLAGGKKAADL